MYVFIFAAKLLYLVPAIPGLGILRLLRWVLRELRLGRASNWPVTDAVVESSFEIDESSSRVRTLLGDLLIGSYLQQPPLHTARSPEMVDIQDSTFGNDKSKPWIVGFFYSYRVEGILYSGTFLLPEAYQNSRTASKGGQSWVGKTVTIRYNPDKPESSIFLEADGAPGKPRIPAGWNAEPPVTTLSLK